MSQTWEHDINDISFVIADREVTGLAAGSDSIKVEFDEDKLTVQQGARGDAQVASGHSRTGTLTTKLLAGNPLNGYLFALLERQQRSLNKFEISIENTKTGAGFFSGPAYILKEPPVDFGNEAQESVEWQFKFTQGRWAWPDGIAAIFSP